MMDQAFLKLIGDFQSVRDPRTGEPIEFRIHKNENSYLYFVGPHRELYCYSPHADVNGNYWCWTYQPYGKGSRSDKPSNWRVIDLVRCAKRRTAKARAFKRMQRAMKGVM